jgi:hypothetical protein
MLIVPLNLLVLRNFHWSTDVTKEFIFFLDIVYWKNRNGVYWIYFPKPFLDPKVWVVLIRHSAA